MANRNNYVVEESEYYYCTPQEQAEEGRKKQQELLREVENYVCDFSSLGSEAEDDTGPNHGHRRSNGSLELNGIRREEHRRSIPGKNHSPLDVELMLSVREREIAELRRAYDEIRTTLEEKEIIISKLSRERVETEKQWTVDRNEVNSLKKRLETLMVDLRQREEVISQRDENLQLLRLDLQSKERLIKTLETGSAENRQVAVLEGQIKDMEARFKKREAENEDFMQGHLRKYQKLDAEKVELEMQIKNFKAKYDDLSTEKAMEITRLLNEKLLLEEQLKARKGGPDPKVVELEALIQTLRWELEEKKTFTERMQQSHAQTMAEKRTSEDSLLNDRVKELLRTLAQKEERIHELTCELASSRNSLTNATSPKSRMDDESLEELRRRNLEAIRKTEIQEKNTVIENLKRENEEVKKLYLDLKDSHEVQKTLLQEDLVSANRSLQDLQIQHAMLCQQELEKRANEIEQLRQEKTSLAEKIADLESRNAQNAESSEKLSDQQVADIIRFSEEIKKIEQNHVEEIEKMKSAHVAEVKQHRDEFERLTSALNTLREMKPSPEVRSSIRRTDSATSPEEKCMTETEVTYILQHLAAKHDQEIMKLKEVIALSEAGSSKGSSPPTGSKSGDISPDLFVQLLNKHDEVYGQYVRAITEVEKLKKEVTTAKTDSSEFLDKYNKLKGQSKQYKEHFEKVIKKIKDKYEKDREMYEKDRKKWESDREASRKVAERFEAERQKRERAYEMALEEMQRLRFQHTQLPPLLSLEDLYKKHDEQLNRLK